MSMLQHMTPEQIANVEAMLDAGIAAEKKGWQRTGADEEAFERLASLRNMVRTEFATANHLLDEVLRLRSRVQLQAKMIEELQTETGITP